MTASKNYDFSSGIDTSIRRRILTNSSLLGGSRALSAVMGLATLIIAARALDDQAAFGTLLFIHAYMLFFSEVVSLKIWQAIIRFGADDVKSDDPNSFGRLIKTSLILDVICAVAAFVIAALFFELFLWFRSLLGEGEPVLYASGADQVSLKKLVVIYCLVILFRQFNVATGIFRLFDKYTILAVRALVMPTVRLIGVIIAYYQDWGLVGFLSVWFVASFLSYITLQIFAFYELSKRKLLPFIYKAKFAHKSDIVGFFPFIIKTSIDSTLNAFKTYFPSLIIMVSIGPASLAVLRIAEEIARLLSRGVAIFDEILLPEIARLITENKLAELLKLISKSALYIGLVSFAISLVVMIWGQALITKGFEAGYEDADLLAVLLLFASSILSISVPFYSTLYMLKRPGQAVWLRVIGIFVYFLIFILTFKTFGLFAAAWAAIGAALIEIILVIYRSLKIAKSSVNED